MNKANDLIMLSAVLFLLILNPLFAFINPKKLLTTNNRATD